jgi:hypothetical protein
MPSVPSRASVRACGGTDGPHVQGEAEQGAGGESGASEVGRERRRREGGKWECGRSRLRAGGWSKVDSRWGGVGEGTVPLRSCN